MNLAKRAGVHQPPADEGGNGHPGLLLRAPPETVRPFEREMSEDGGSTNDQVSQSLQVLRVAVLDDDRDAVASVTAILNQRGFRASAFTDAGQLEDAASTGQFVAFVLDWFLGSATAAPLIARLRARQASSRAPIFLLSGNLAVGGVPSDPGLASAIDQYGLQYRAKPYSSVKLAVDLRQSLARTAT